jgi:photosystem II stability/assembly factor-like uncharacterized protein
VSIQWRPPRIRRSLALIAASVIVIGVASLVYLHPFRTAKTQGGPPSQSSSDRPLMATLNPVTYDFVTPSLGWAVQQLWTPTTPAGGFSVFRTTDGARHWQRQLVAESSFAGFVPLSIQILDPMHGFVGVGDPFEQLVRTTDGGATWDSLPLPSDSARVEGIAFTNTNHGWLLVGGLVPALYTTNDAGNSWRRLPDPPSDALGLSYRSPSEAWMGSAGAGPPHVYLSDDDGNIWTRIDLPPPPAASWAGDRSLVGVDLLPHSGVAAHTPPADQPEQVIFSLSLTSFDRGKSWVYVPVPPGVVAYQDARHWWAIKGKALFKSSDAGQSWRLVTNTLPELQYIPHVLDSKHAWALTIVVGGYGLAVTGDGGLHWSQATVPPAR